MLERKWVKIIKLVKGVIAIFKIGKYEIKNKNLSTTLNQLSKIECEDDSVSISGTIISIEDTPYILSRISLNVGNSLDIKNRLTDINWSLINLVDGNRYTDPLTLEDLFNLLIYYYHKDWNIKVINHIENLKEELYKLLEVQDKVWLLIY